MVMLCVELTLYYVHFPSISLFHYFSNMQQEFNNDHGIVSITNQQDTLYCLSSNQAIAIPITFKTLYDF